MRSPAGTARNSQPRRARPRVEKRSFNACVRCRRQKIKCSGSQPCEACKKRRLSCEFDERDQRILVTKGYILDLQRQIRSQRRDVPPASCNGTASAPGLRATTPRNSARGRSGDDDEESSPAALTPPTAEADAADLPVRDDTTLVPGSSKLADDDNEPTHQPSRLDPVASSLKNPLATAPSTFMTASDGRCYYLGTSSNWSFTRRVLNLAHEFVHQSAVAPYSLLFDGTTYNLPWDGSRDAPGPEAPTLPSLDHAIYLINAVKFHCAQIFHLFEDETFMEAFYGFYADPGPQISDPSLFYIHLLLVLAFGKTLVGHNLQAKPPPGCEFFTKALQLLPDIHILSRKPVMSTEILCCVALYFQCLDHRTCAHNFIGQAMRLALSNGMHTSMPVHQLGVPIVERCRRIWWTIYIMDSEMTSLMGLPQSVDDGDIQAELPAFAGSAQRASALRMQIRLSQTVAKIGREVYGADGRLNRMFLASTKNVLSSVAGLADELRQMFPLPQDRTSLYGIPRMSAYLHLLYHQCIVLATRPLLLCFLKIQFESPESYIDTLTSSTTVRNLMELCMESSQQIVSILSSLQEQGLLEKFLPHDLESLFVATVDLILGPALDPNLGDNPHYWLEKAYELFGEFTQSGNLIAQLRRSELRQLDDMLSARSWQNPPTATARDDSQSHQHDHSRGSASASQVMSESMVMNNTREDDNPFPSPITGTFDLGWEGGLTTAQMLDLANSIEIRDTEWMQHAIMEHSIW